MYNMKELQKGLSDKLPRVTRDEELLDVFIVRVLLNNYKTVSQLNKKLEGGVLESHEEQDKLDNDEILKSLEVVLKYYGIYNVQEVL